MVMRITLAEETGKFNFTVASKDLDSAISRLSAVLSTSSAAKSFLLVGYKEKIALVAFTPDTFVYMLVGSGSSDGPGYFGFVPQTLQGVIKGRSDMQFSFTGSECEFKLTKGKYSGKFVTLPVSSDQIATVNTILAVKKSKSDDVGGSVLPRSVLDTLKEGIGMTSIKDVYTGTSLLTYMTLNAKGVLTVSAFDNHHFGFYKAKVDAGGNTFRAALPSNHFLTLERMIEGEEVQFYIKSENIRVEGSNFMLILPSTQTEEKNYTLIESYIKDLDKSKFTCGFNCGKLISLTDNLFTLHAVNTAFELAHKDGSSALSVTFSTSNGSAKDMLKVETTLSATVAAKIDPRILKDMLPLINGHESPVMSIVPGKVFRLDCGSKSGAHVTLVSALVG